MLPRSFPAMILLCGCHRGTEACALPPASEDVAAVAGDANGDGIADVADPIFVHRYLFGGGPAPACDAAADVVADGTVEAGDGFTLVSWLYTGQTTSLPSPACASRTTPEAPACGRADLSIVADDAKVTGPSGADVTFHAKVVLEDAGIAVDGWSISVKADGCGVSQATTAGTAGADATIDGSGLRRVGWERTEPTSGGAVSAVGLSWSDDLALPEGTSTLLDLTVTARAEDGCQTCTLTLEDGEQGAGQPVVDALSVGGFSFRPGLGSARVRICGS